MAGKNCNGVATDQPYLSNTRAYCEGRGVAAAGGTAPDNPHHPGPDADAWGRGFDSWIADPAGGPPGAQDCCALKYGGGYTP